MYWAIPPLQNPHTPNKIKSLHFSGFSVSLNPLKTILISLPLSAEAKTYQGTTASVAEPEWDSTALVLEVGSNLTVSNHINSHTSTSVSTPAYYDKPQAMYVNAEAWLHNTGDNFVE